MSKSNELATILDGMIEAGKALIKSAEALKNHCSMEPEEPKQTPEEKPSKTAPAKKEKTLSKEEVRRILAAKANEEDGEFQVIVKDLVVKYANGGTFKDVPPEMYTNLVKEVESIHE